MHTFLEGFQALLHLFLLVLVGSSSHNIGLQLLHLRLEVSFLLRQALGVGLKKAGKC